MSWVYNEKYLLNKNGMHSDVVGLRSPADPEKKIRKNVL